MGSSPPCAAAAGCIVRPAEWKPRLTELGRVSEKFGCHSEVIKTPAPPLYLRWEGQIIVTGLSKLTEEGGQSEM